MTNKMHIEGGTARIDAIRHYLDLIDRSEYSSVDAVMDDAYHRFGFPDPAKYPQLDKPEVNTKNMASTLTRLGLVEDDNPQQVTDLGQQLVDVLLRDEKLFYEFFHFIYATAYAHRPDDDRLISWAYYQISNEIYDKAPVECTNDFKQEIVDTVMFRAEEAEGPGFDDPGPLSTKSLNNYLRFIQSLDPTVYDEESNTIHLRDYAREELVLLAIDHVYRSERVMETADYGDLIELTDDVIDQVCTICLVEEEAFHDLVEDVAARYRQLSTQSDYALRIRLSEPIKIDEIA